MPRKIVDVFVRDEFIKSYHLEWNLLHAPLFEQDFIDRARELLHVDGYSTEEIDAARFALKDDQD